MTRASLEVERKALRVRGALGVKFRVISQEAPPNKVAGNVPQVLLTTEKSPGFAPVLMFSEEMTADLFPILVRVIVWFALVAPTTVSGKFV